MNAASFVVGVWTLGLGLLGAPQAGAQALGPSPDEARAAFEAAAALRGTPAEASAFQKAAAVLEETRIRDGADSTLLLNQGHAYLLGGDLPQAILAFRRGLRLDPEDKELLRSLDYARLQVVYPRRDAIGRSTASGSLRLLRLSLWALAAAGAFFSCLVSCLTLTQWLMTPRPQLLAVATTCSVVAAALAALLAIQEWNRAHERGRPLAVIAADGVLLRKGNGLSYPPRYEQPIHRGVEAHVLFVRGDWVQVELTGGEVGWVARNSVLLDYP